MMNITRNFCQRFVHGYIKRCNLSYSQKRLCSQSCSGKLMAHLQAKMKFSGPITVAEYMKEALTHATAGYYINRDVFGVKGDFITSPEISQMFGELVAIWFVNEWMMAGSPEKVQLVELGPGRGTMADDILRTFKKFPEITKAVSLHFVEVSRTLSELQEKKLSSDPDRLVQENTTEPHYKTCTSKYGPDVYWHRDVVDVPQAFTMFVAHEFFDALPIHKFQKIDGKWREVLVDVDPESEDSLRFVLAPSVTPASKTLLEVSGDEKREHIEVCPQAALTVQHISDQINQYGGCALLADYGHTGEKDDTFRGFKEHELHDVLEDPGTADLTADVDFSYLKKHAADKVNAFGPVTQSHFLQNMGIAYRLKILYEKADEAGKEDLLSAFYKLTSPEDMGERFKFMALINNKLPHNPVGFDSLPEEETTETPDPTS